jgi:hypothetical protein
LLFFVSSDSEEDPTGLPGGLKRGSPDASKFLKLFKSFFEPKPTALFKNADALEK